MWQNVKSVIAFLCILVYIAAAAFAVTRIYKAAAEQRFNAQQEFADLTDFAAGAGVLGFFSGKYIEDIKTQLDMSKALDAVIINGPDNNKAAFEKKPGLILYKGDTPDFNKQAKFYRAPQSAPLRVEGNQNISISAFSPLINFNTLLAVLRSSLLAILIAVFIAFFTLIIDISFIKTKEQIPYDPDAPQIDSFNSNTTLHSGENEDELPARNSQPDAPFYTEEAWIDEEAPSAYGEEAEIDEEVPAAYGEEAEIDEEAPAAYGEEAEIDEEAPAAYGEEAEIDEEAPSAYEEEAEIDEEAPSAYEEEAEIDEEAPAAYKEEAELDEETPAAYKYEAEMAEEIPGTNAEEAETGEADAQAEEAGPHEEIPPAEGLLAAAKAIYETDNFGSMDDSAAFIDSLQYELQKAEAEDNDLTLLCIEWTAAGLQEEVLIKQAAAFFKNGSRVFEREAQSGVYVIVPGFGLDKILADAKEFHRRARELMPQNLYVELLMGISARSDRNVDAVNLLSEAECALDKARSDSALPIVAFKADPQKYKEFMRRQKELS
ncbi:MAG: hypothetical protein LBK66_13840 [Spirochaetaceae bacterium]|jgi:hypothetical protein|nr:hypothetical protein [Spirochaetaceae bacterium]